jgi:uncharacterized protein (TIGR03435 family)
MTRVFAALGLAALLFVPAFAQSTAPQPKFEFADVHTSPRTTNPNMRSVFRGGRYELHNANMVDLIRTAYGVDPEKVVGGPNWVEFDRFDVIAKVPSNTPPETLKLMLQSLLTERFKLVVHNDTQPIAGVALTIGKGKSKLKEAEPSGRMGCQIEPPTPIARAAGQVKIPLTSVSCRNVTMEAFASELRRFANGYVTNSVVDSTGLKGSWDFDLKWTPKALLPLAGSDGVTLFDAVDKQLGLKLEEQKLPLPVIVVDQVNRTPTGNPPDVEATLPALPPAEFEVADIKPAMPDERPRAGGAIGFLPGGRVNLPGFPLRAAIVFAWNLNFNDEIVGAPKWLDSARFDIVAKAPVALAPTNGPAPFQDLGPMLQALLKDRFKMQAHFEDRPVTAYTLVAAKPKLKKADPSGRTGCKLGNAPGGVVTSGPFGPFPLPVRLVTCQNITMAQFADQLQMIAGPYVNYPVLDGTGIDGAWDFTFSFNLMPPNRLEGLRGTPPGGLPADAGVASDPVGGTSFFDAVQKQLGLKLEAQKRPYPVLVIDHIEEKPTDN